MERKLRIGQRSIGSVTLTCTCVENVSRSNCPVCLEDIHTSRIPCHIPDCGHLLHRPCFEQLLHSGHYACPTCQTSMIDMTNLWSYLDSEVAATPMPPEYADYKATILCKDCHKLSTVKDSNSTPAGDSSTATSTSTSRSGSSSATFPETREETQNDELPRANPMDEPPQA
ncbi:hypothetical protein HF086_017833 [Spodoptera exigua]|uniref:RING-type domain-containing protein n=1 Tax=Spodoptera exigua TaxID=7107 RepID=A0A922MSF5_SPOEX|nr:hypothetical protein HF086_017833 [Spodoptera exigua]